MLKVYLRIFKKTPEAAGSDMHLSYCLTLKSFVFMHNIFFSPHLLSKE